MSISTMKRRVGALAAGVAMAADCRAPTDVLTESVTSYRCAASVFGRGLTRLASCPSTDLLWVRSGLGCCVVVWAVGHAVAG